MSLRFVPYNPADPNNLEGKSPIPTAANMARVTELSRMMLALQGKQMRVDFTKVRVVLREQDDELPDDLFERLVNLPLDGELSDEDFEYLVNYSKKHPSTF